MQDSITTPSGEYEPSIAELIIQGAVGQLEHGKLCGEAKIKLVVSGARRRIICGTCQSYAQLPGAEEYDAAWAEITSRPIVDLPLPTARPEPPAPPAGHCFHGIPHSQDCAQCRKETQDFGLALPTPTGLLGGGRILPPGIRGV